MTAQRCKHGWSFVQGCRACTPVADWRDDYERRTVGRMGSRYQKVIPTAGEPCGATDLGPTEGLSRLTREDS